MDINEVQTFGMAVAKQFGTTTCEQYRGHHWAFAFEIEPRIFVFGRLVKGKFVYNLFARDGGEQKSSSIEAGASVHRGAQAAADAIRNKLLPDALPITRQLLANIDKANEDHKAMVAWLDGMKAKYPRLRGTVDKGYADCTLYGGDAGCVAFTARMADGKPRMSLGRVSLYGDKVLSVLDLVKE